jgi:hypothetical protein
MKKGCIKHLTRGISLEKSKTLVPWKTCFDSLYNYGNAEIKVQTGRRMIVWKNEKILNGISVDLNVTLNDNAKGEQLENVSAYISESDFKKVRTQLNSELKKKGQYVKFNDFEYAYKWKVNGCDVVLSCIDRFGSYWKLDINHRGTIIDRFMKNTIHRFKMPCIKPDFNLDKNLMFFGVRTPQTQLVVI